MLSLIQTAERTTNTLPVSNYVYQRHVFAYNSAIRYLGDNVVELGCGSGYGMQILAASCNWYVGLDKYIPDNRKADFNTAFFKARFPDLDNIGSNSFDTVICFQVIEHVKEDQRFLKEAWRLLRPGGKLLLTTPNKLMSLTRNPFHIREYTPYNIRELIGSRFSRFDIQGVYGNDTVKEYYKANRRSVEKILRWDVLNLQHRLPSALLKLPYNVLNNINRKLISNNDPERSAGISSADFYIDKVAGTCLDFFVVAEKE